MRVPSHQDVDNLKSNKHSNDRDAGGVTASQTGKRERGWLAADTPLSARSTALFMNLLIFLMLYKRPGTSAFTKCYDTNTGRCASLIQ